MGLPFLLLCDVQMCLGGQVLGWSGWGRPYCCAPLNIEQTVCQAAAFR